MSLKYTGHPSESSATDSLEACRIATREPSEAVSSRDDSVIGHDLEPAPIPGAAHRRASTAARQPSPPALLALQERIAELEAALLSHESDAAASISAAEQRIRKLGARCTEMQKTVEHLEGVNTGLEEELARSRARGMVRRNKVSSGSAGALSVHIGPERSPTNTDDSTAPDASERTTFQGMAPSETAEHTSTGRSTSYRSFHSAGSLTSSFKPIPSSRSSSSFGRIPSIGSTSTYWFTLRRALATRLMPEWTALEGEVQPTSTPAVDQSHEGLTYSDGSTPEGKDDAPHPAASPNGLGRLVVFLGCVPALIAVLAIGRTVSGLRRAFS